MHVVLYTMMQSAPDLDTKAEGITSSIRYLRHHLKDLLIQLDAIQLTDQHDLARHRRQHIVQQNDGFLTRNAV